MLKSRTFSVRDFLYLFFAFAAATGTTRTAAFTARTATALRAANTFFTAFLSFNYIADNG